MSWYLRRVGAIVAVLAAGCSSGKPAAPHTEAPAHVESPKKEAELTTVKLSPEAVKRLGIEIVTVKTESAAATRWLGGEVTVPEGRLVTVTAPVAGTVSAVSAVLPGARVTRGARLMTLAPLASSERDQSIEARRAVDAAQAEADTARRRVARLEQLLKEGAASVRSVEEARGQLQVAEAALNAARERLSAIQKGPVGPQGEIVITAPLDGVIQSMSAASGQTVASAAPLVQIAQVNTLWVRVPVFAGDVEQIDTSQPASVKRLGGSSVAAAGKARHRAAQSRSGGGVGRSVLRDPGRRHRAAPRRACDGGNPSQEPSAGPRGPRGGPALSTFTETPGSTRISEETPTPAETRAGRPPLRRSGGDRQRPDRRPESRHRRRRRTVRH